MGNIALNLLGTIIVFVILSLAVAHIVGGLAKVNQVLNWEFNQFKKFVKFILSLIIKMLQALHRKI